MSDDYKGMTVNERLYVSGLIDEFDHAVENKNIEGVKQILKQVNLPDDAICPILQKVGLGALKLRDEI